MNLSAGRFVAPARRCHGRNKRSSQRRPRAAASRGGKASASGEPSCAGFAFSKARPGEREPPTVHSTAFVQKIQTAGDEAGAEQHCNGDLRII